MAESIGVTASQIRFAARHTAVAGVPRQILAVVEIWRGIQRASSGAGASVAVDGRAYTAEYLVCGIPVEVLLLLFFCRGVSGCGAASKDKRADGRKNGCARGQAEDGAHDSVSQKDVVREIVDDWWIVAREARTSSIERSRTSTGRNHSSPACQCIAKLYP